MLVQIRDLGRRLEYVAAQYDRLVRGLLGSEATPPGSESHVHLVNREVGDVTARLQELLVQQDEACRRQKGGSTRRAERPCHEPRPVSAPTGVGRSSVVTPFVSASCRQRPPVVSPSTRVAVSP